MIYNPKDSSQYRACEGQLDIRCTFETLDEQPDYIFVNLITNADVQLCLDRTKGIYFK